MFKMSHQAEHFPLQYDPDFMADINLKMHIPDRIGITGNDDRWPQPQRMPVNIYQDITTMNVPEKIVILGQDQSVGVKEEPNLHLDLVSMPSIDEFTNVSTPPRILTLEDHPFLEADDDLADDEKSRGFGKRKKKKDNVAFDGFHSQFSQYKKETETAVIRRQLSGLSQQIAKLERENLSRSRREMVLYPFLLGYVLFQVIRWAIKQ